MVIYPYILIDHIEELACWVDIAIHTRDTIDTTNSKRSKNGDGLVYSIMRIHRGWPIFGYTKSMYSLRSSINLNNARPAI